MRETVSIAEFLRHTRGVTAVEFSLALPLLGVILLGFIEYDHYTRTARQMETAANAITQMLSQAREVTPSDMAYAID